MKRPIVLILVALALVLVSSGAAYAQAIFKMPFKFQAGPNKLPPGEYSVAQKEEGQITLRQESTGKEVQVLFTERIAQPDPAKEEPQLVFDMVGNFEPSYTEYVTEYVLSEVWLPGQDGFLIRALKGAHQHQVVKGVKPTK